ncbi:MAG: hypothetical protein IJ455_08050 [Agathobacter sp.]|nr:hypothetical protein [Agathobacter sp.]
MKLVKKLVVLAAALTMVLSLVACGGEKFPQTYKYTVDWVMGTRGEVAELTLNEDGTFDYSYTATDSKDANKTVMSLEVTGTYEKDGNTVKVAVESGSGYAMNGDTKMDLKVSADDLTWYKMTYAAGATTFEIEGDVFVPVE